MSEDCCFTCGLLNRRPGTYYSQFSSSQLKNKFSPCVLKDKIKNSFLFSLSMCILHSFMQCLTWENVLIFFFLDLYIVQLKLTTLTLIFPSLLFMVWSDKVWGKVYLEELLYFLSVKLIFVADHWFDYGQLLLCYQL